MAEGKVKSRSHVSKMIGRVFNRLTVEKATDRRTPSQEMIYQCRCACGKEVFIRGSSLKTGGSRSCGCLRNERSKLAMLRRHAERRASQPPPLNQPPREAEHPTKEPMAPNAGTPSGVSCMDLIWMQQARTPKVRYRQ